MYFVDPRRVTIAFGIIRRATVCGVRGNRPNSVTSGDGMEGVVYGAQLSMRASARLAYQPPPLAWQTFETLLTSWAQAADPFGPRHPPKSTPGNASFLALTRISRAPSVILFTPSPLCCRHTSCYIGTLRAIRVARQLVLGREAAVRRHSYTCLAISQFVGSSPSKWSHMDSRHQHAHQPVDSLAEVRSR